MRWFVASNKKVNVSRTKTNCIMDTSFSERLRFPFAFAGEVCFPAIVYKCS